MKRRRRTSPDKNKDTPLPPFSESIPQPPAATSLLLCRTAPIPFFVSSHIAFKTPNPKYFIQPVKALGPASLPIVLLVVQPRQQLQIIPDSASRIHPQLTAGPWRHAHGRAPRGFAHPPVPAPGSQPEEITVLPADKAKPSSPTSSQSAAPGSSTSTDRSIPFTRIFAEPNETPLVGYPPVSGRERDAREMEPAHPEVDRSV